MARSVRTHLHRGPPGADSGAVHRVSRPAPPNPPARIVAHGMARKSLPRLAAHNRSAGGPAGHSPSGRSAPPAGRATPRQVLNGTAWPRQKKQALIHVLCTAHHLTLSNNTAISPETNKDQSATPCFAPEQRYPRESRHLELPQWPQHIMVWVRAIALVAALEIVLLAPPHGCVVPALAQNVRRVDPCALPGRNRKACAHLAKRLFDCVWTQGRGRGLRRVIRMPLPRGGWLPRDYLPVIVRVKCARGVLLGPSPRTVSRHHARAHD